MIILKFDVLFHEMPWKSSFQTRGLLQRELGYRSNLSSQLFLGFPSQSLLEQTWSYFRRHKHFSAQYLKLWAPQKAELPTTTIVCPILQISTWAKWFWYLSHHCFSVICTFCHGRLWCCFCPSVQQIQPASHAAFEQSKTVKKIKI